MQTALPPCLDKTCTGCHQKKPIGEFNWKDRAKGVMNTQCKSCKRAYGKAHYQANTQAYVDKASVHNEKYRDRNRAIVAEFLATQECTACGAKDDLSPYAGGPQNGQTVWSAVGSGLAESSVLDALGRSIVICSACLGMHTSKSLEAWQGLTHAERIALKAEKTAKGETSKNPAYYRNYIGKEEAASEREARLGSADATAPSPL